MALNKGELITILVNQYGYEKEDLKFDVNGNPYTNAKLQAMINAEIADSEEMEANAFRITSKDTTGLKDEDKVKVMSGSSGTVLYRSDTSRRMWKFTKFGQMDNMPYGELVTIRNQFPRYFREGWIVVLDAKVQEEFKLTEMYKNILTPDNIDEVFDKDIEELAVLVKNLPEGMKNTFINKAQELFDTKKLNSMRVVELIEDSFGFSLRDNAPTEDYALKSDLGQQNIIYVDKR